MADENINAKGAFVTNWRPTAGWVCVAGLAYNYVLQPLLNGFLAPLHMHFEPLDVTTLITLCSSFIGLSGLRSFDKLKGVTK
jgi:hypothetical protein